MAWGRLVDARISSRVCRNNSWSGMFFGNRSLNVRKK